MSRDMISFSFEAQSRTDSGEVKAFHAHVFTPSLDDTGVWICKAEINGTDTLLRTGIWPEEAYHVVCEAVREWCRGRGLKLIDAEGNHRKFLPPLSFVPFRRSGVAHFADGLTQSLLVEVGIPFRINVSPGSEFACGVYFGLEGEIGPLLGDTPDKVYAQAFQLLRRSFEQYGAEFIDDAGRPIEISAPCSDTRPDESPRTEP